MKPLTARKLISTLESNGFVLTRTKGSHAIYRNSSGVIVPVPLHGKNRPVHIGTFLAIIKQSRLPKRLFLE